MNYSLSPQSCEWHYELYGAMLSIFVLYLALMEFKMLAHCIASIRYGNVIHLMMPIPKLMPMITNKNENKCENSVNITYS